MFYGGKLTGKRVLYICEKIMEKHIFEALYKNYFPLVFRRCMELLRNNEDAENAANTVFEKLFKKKDIIHFPRSYLYRMATNMGLKQKEQRRKEAAYIYTEATNTSINRLKEKGEGEIRQLLKEKKQDTYDTKMNFVDKSYEYIEAEIIVNAVLKEEDKITRVIYLLFYHDDMTYKDIGKIIGLSKSAIEKRIRKLEKIIKYKIYGDKK